jgi:hypothetical protein
MEKIAITEDSGIHKEWFEEARKQTLETLPEFGKKLFDTYEHDYGTIVHAITAFAVGAAWAANNHPGAGITGFQASFVMWGFIKQWSKTSNELGLRMIDWDDLMYPQHKDRFVLSIDTKQAAKLQEKAKAEIAGQNGNVHPNVMAHWQKLAAGEMPFGVVVKDN